MITIQELRSLVEEQKTDYSKFDALVRAGLANKAQLQRMHKILDKMGEEKPNFTNADRMIIQNLFSKMVDMLTNNKQIFAQAKKSVSEGVQDTADYKLSPSGKKVRAHKIELGLKKDDEVKEEVVQEAFRNDPPFVLVLKRRGIRLYPDGTRIALYYNERIDKYFSIPYGPEFPGMQSSTVQAEQIEEAVMDQLHKIVKDKQSNTVKFANGQTKKVDHFTASAITKVHAAVNDENKKKLETMVHKSPEHLAKVADFAFQRMK
jgi:hypothetical protein